MSSKRTQISTLNTLHKSHTSTFKRSVHDAGLCVSKCDGYPNEVFYSRLQTNMQSKKTMPANRGHVYKTHESNQNVSYTKLFESGFFPRWKIKWIFADFSSWRFIDRLAFYWSAKSHTIHTWLSSSGGNNARIYLKSPRISLQRAPSK